jgi:outer membrane beta-barrel protein
VNRRLTALVVLALAAAAAAPALAAEPERVVVRNRKFTVAGKFEVSAGGGATLVNYLTSHENLQASFGYNFAETLALELSGGWAFSSQTNVADAVSSEVVRADPNSTQKQVDDFEDLWRMTWNATGAVRWAPLYGKVNVAAELPIHFQAFLLAGAGAGGMVRDSLVYCIGQPLSRSSATCSANPGNGPNALKALHDAKVKPLFTGGFGLRFFVVDRVGLKVEIRDVAFPDSFREKITRALAELDSGARDGGDAAATQGQPAASPGITHLVFAQVGVTFQF